MVPISSWPLLPTTPPNQMAENGTVLARRADDLSKLPVELVRFVLESAAETASCSRAQDLVAYSLVSTSVRAWILPIVYRTIEIDTERKWRAFCSAARRHGALPVQNLSVIAFQPPAADFVLTLDLLPLVNNVQVPLCLAELLPQTRAALTIRRLFLSKHGPPNGEPLAPGLFPRVTHVFYEQFYTGLYPAPMRASLPRAFPGATHFGMFYLWASGDAVARDMLELARDILALPHMQRFYVRVYAQEHTDAVRDAGRMRAVCAALRDPRVIVGPATIEEWSWWPGGEGTLPFSTVWASDAHKRSDLWDQGEPAYVKETTLGEAYQGRR